MGVYTSTGAGATWTLCGQTLRYRHVSSIAINRTGTNLHAGTNHGVFEYQIA